MSAGDETGPHRFSVFAICACDSLSSFGRLHGIRSRRLRGRDAEPGRSKEFLSKSLGKGLVPLGWLGLLGHCGEQEACACLREIQKLPTHKNGQKPISPGNTIYANSIEVPAVSAFRRLLRKPDPEAGSWAVEALGGEGLAVALLLGAQRTVSRRFSCPKAWNQTA